eukprot:TRINITY_DN5661_c0_g1_i3.p2 TRINITY_DN5661_c0_g1~~TRINITY_DN5661_c0_g1_i3.p2  ORF type:complete len:141 (-),score=71.53 TRINITY_DN5661_c0_g1_i3:76-447(-)
MVKIKATDLRKKKKPELEKQLEELKTELGGLRVAQVTGGAPSKLAKIRGVRKSIARVLTVMNQKQKAALRKHYSGKRFKPLDLRPKLTRAKRLALKPCERNALTVRQIKRRKNFPMRKYAIKL